MFAVVALQRLSKNQEQVVQGSLVEVQSAFFGSFGEKLAFLVDSTSAPIASLALISTWIMYEVTLFGQSAETMGIADSGYSIFLDVLRYPDVDLLWQYDRAG